MSYVTRDLLSMALSRNAGELITYDIKTMTPNGNGSYTATSNSASVLARVVDLQQNEIKRLQDRGITIKSGVSIGIVGELPKVPDIITRANGIKMKVVFFTISENATIIIADVMPLGAT